MFTWEGGMQEGRPCALFRNSCVHTCRCTCMLGLWVLIILPLSMYTLTPASLPPSLFLFSLSCHLSTVATAESKKEKTSSSEKEATTPDPPTTGEWLYICLWIHLSYTLVVCNTLLLCNSDTGEPTATSPPASAAGDMTDRTIPLSTVCSECIHMFTMYMWMCRAAILFPNALYLEILTSSSYSSFICTL